MEKEKRKWKTISEKNHECNFTFAFNLMGKKKFYLENWIVKN